MALVFKIRTLFSAVCADDGFFFLISRLTVTADLFKELGERSSFMFSSVSLSELACDLSTISQSTNVLSLLWENRILFMELFLALTSTLWQLSTPKDTEMVGLTLRTTVEAVLESPQSPHRSSSVWEDTDTRGVVMLVSAGLVGASARENVQLSN